MAPGFLLGMKRMASVLFICVFGVSSLLTLKIFPATPFCGFLYEEDFTRASTKTNGYGLAKVRQLNQERRVMIFHSNTIFSCLGLKGPLGAQS